MGDDLRMSRASNDAEKDGYEVNDHLWKKCEMWGFIIRNADGLSIPQMTGLQMFLDYVQEHFDELRMAERQKIYEEQAQARIQ